MNYVKILLLTVFLINYYPAIGQKKADSNKAIVPPANSDTIIKPVVETILTDSLAALLNLKFKSYKKSVHASYYHDKFNGRRTASGKKFSNNKFTAAHRKFPFGTKLRITNTENGKSVVVEVIDRGPFTRGREIDLTRKAFMAIADEKRGGGMKVNIEVEKSYTGE